MNLFRVNKGKKVVIGDSELTVFRFRLGLLMELLKKKLPAVAKAVCCFTVDNKRDSGIYSTSSPIGVKDEDGKDIMSFSNQVEAISPELAALRYDQQYNAVLDLVEVLTTDRKESSLLIRILKDAYREDLGEESDEDILGLDINTVITLLAEAWEYNKDSFSPFLKRILEKEAFNKIMGISSEGSEKPQES